VLQRHGAREPHQAQDSIYFRGADDRTLYVNLFVPSTPRVDRAPIVVRQRTDFPIRRYTRLIIEGGGAFDIRVRVPRWPPRVLREHQRPQRGRKGRSGRLRVAAQDLAPRTTRSTCASRFRVPPGARDGPAQLASSSTPGAARAEEPAPRSDWRPIALDAGDIAASIRGPRHAPLHDRRRPVQAVLRDVRPPLGVRALTLR